ncbi:unnamed protein product [Discula destructiva]
MASVSPQPPGLKSKRLIVCCDGTWENALGATSDKPQTNVTRLSRSLKQICSDGTTQVVYYHPGVGTGGEIDALLGGVFGMGLGADIREAYNFICANFVDGDDIVLVGFSRGAFTARSIADLIASIGLLNVDGMANFYSIFEDYENMGDENGGSHDFLDDSAKYLASYNGETGKARILWENKRKNEYRQWLKSRHWTRDTHQDGTLIRIKAVAVWDTVGSLGIPATPVIGIHGSAAQWKFTNTQISSKVEHAFQALSMDEPRASFRPALWERLEGNTVTYLKQVWFPGSHANIGGGWCDQQVACITLAWICDQLTPLGVEFSHHLTDIFISALRYSAAHPYPFVPSPSIFLPSWLWTIVLEHQTPIPWASSPTPCPEPKPSQHRDTADCTGRDDCPNGPYRDLWKYGGRNWGLGQTRLPTNKIILAAGTIVRRPGCFMRVDPELNTDTEEPLINTNERVHSSVRVRLACKGMGLDDKETWPCDSLLTDDSHQSKPLWKLERGSAIDPRQLESDEDFWTIELRKKEYDGVKYEAQDGDGSWKWVLQQDGVVKNSVGKVVCPMVKVLPEEPLLGYWERHFLELARGELDVWRFAEGKTLGSSSPAKMV